MKVLDAYTGSSPEKFFKYKSFISSKTNHEYWFFSIDITYSNYKYTTDMVETLLTFFQIQM